MKNLSLSHHAYVVEGQKDFILPILVETLVSKFGVNTKANPDFTQLHFESFGIDESRKLKEMQSSKSISDGKRFFIISTNSVTIQAQNSMLKMFEEPGENTHFFLILPTLSILIETLLSRVEKLEISGGEKKEGIDAKIFMKSTHPERLKIVEKFLKANKESKEIKSLVSNFFSDIEIILAKDLNKNKSSLENLLNIKKYIFDTSSSVKILLETAALTFPIF